MAGGTFPHASHGGLILSTAPRTMAGGTFPHASHGGLILSPPAGRRRWTDAAARPRRAWRRDPWSEAERVPEGSPVISRVAEQQRRRLGPLQVQMGIVLPGEPDPAVD